MIGIMSTAHAIRDVETYEQYIIEYPTGDDVRIAAYDKQIMPLEVVEADRDTQDYQPNDDDTVMGGLKNLLPSRDKRKESSLQVHIDGGHAAKVL